MNAPLNPPFSFARALTPRVGDTWLLWLPPKDLPGASSELEAVVAVVAVSAEGCRLEAVWRSGELTRRTCSGAQYAALVHECFATVATFEPAA